jgi:hypothetical protein
MKIFSYGAAVLAGTESGSATVVMGAESGSATVIAGAESGGAAVIAGAESGTILLVGRLVLAASSVFMPASNKEHQTKLSSLSIFSNVLCFRYSSSTGSKCFILFYCNG